MAAMMIRSNGMLNGQIEELAMSNNPYISGLSVTIIEKMEGSG